MKIKNIKTPKSKLLQLQIFKLFYKKNSLNVDTNFKQTEIYLNKISNIIYKYHITNKKILFIGFPQNFNKIIKNTKHIYIPASVWFNGLLNNRVNAKENAALNTFKLVINLKKKVDLVVICNLTNKTTTAIKESYIARIPVISINRKLSIRNIKTTYKSNGSYNLMNEKMENNNLFSSLIKATLNRAKNTKTIKKHGNLKTLKNKYKNFKKRFFN